jgi:hypothetical protein
MRAFAPIVAAAFVLAAGSASASPQRDTLVRPGVGIGKVRLGMTFAEVRRALGRPEAVLERQRLGFGAHYAEYAWGGSEWIVAVYGRDDRPRVVSVATGVQRERTRRGVGVGSTERAVRRTLGARCAGKNTGHDPDVYKDTMVCFLGRSVRAPHTLFSLVEDCAVPVPAHANCPPTKLAYLVYEVKVGEPRYIYGNPR